MATPLATSAFVVKLDSALRTILFSTFLNSGSTASAVVTDGSGYIYVAGSTQTPGFSATNFPTTPGSFRTQAPGAFVAKIAPDGTQLIFAAQIGGSQVNCQGGSSCIGITPETTATVLSIDQSGAIVFGGVTDALDLPVSQGALNSTCVCMAGLNSGFLAKLSADGTRLAWLTYINPAFPSTLGEPGLTMRALTLDKSGNPILGGGAQSIPTTPGTLQRALPVSSYQNGFVEKLNSAGSALVWATYLGGTGPASSSAVVNGLKVGATGSIAVTGYADPISLPVPPGTAPLGNTYAGWLSADGSMWQTLYVGPSGSTGQALILGPSGNLETVGQAGSVWIEGSGSRTSLFATGNAAGGPVSGLAAPSELLSIYGSGIGPQMPVSGQVIDGAFTTSLSGYSVLFDGMPAPLLYAGPTQLNVIVPKKVAGQDSTQLQIITPSGTLMGPSLALRTAQPYVFRNAATALSAALNQDGSLNSRANPARPGSIISVYISGGGIAIGPDGVIAPLAGAIPSMLPVSVLGQVQACGEARSSLEVDYAGQAPGLVAGVSQINFHVPPLVCPGGIFSFQAVVGNELGGFGSVAVQP